jgi:hypothetical protein
MLLVEGYADSRHGHEPYIKTTLRPPVGQGQLGSLPKETAVQRSWRVRR